MGSCVSSRSAVTIPPSPVKEKIINGDHPTNGLILKSQWSPSQSTRSFKDHGSKEEAFFDSRPWLESDCEDDFFSVNGDFTPSRGNTPVHTSFMGTPRVTVNREAKTPDPMTEPSPNIKRKKLAELFRDSLGGQEDIAGLDASAEKNIVNGNLEAKPTNLCSLPTSSQGTPQISRATSAKGSERTPNGTRLPEKEKAVRPTECCLPSVVSFRSFRERKKTTSSAIAVHE